MIMKYDVLTSVIRYSLYFFLATLKWIMNFELIALECDVLATAFKSLWRWPGSEYYRIVFM